jgi:hypothetical protein
MSQNSSSRSFSRDPGVNLFIFPPSINGDTDNGQTIGCIHAQNTHAGLTSGEKTKTVTFVLDERMLIKSNSFLF